METKETILNWIKNGKDGKQVIGFCNCLNSDASGPLTNKTVYNNLLAEIEEIYEDGPDQPCEYADIYFLESEYGDGIDIVIDG